MPRPLKTDPDSMLHGALIILAREIKNLRKLQASKTVCLACKRRAGLTPTELDTSIQLADKLRALCKDLHQVKKKAEEGDE